jgi:hypothetical protein
VCMCVCVIVCVYVSALPATVPSVSLDPNTRCVAVCRCPARLSSAFGLARPVCVCVSVCVCVCVCVDVLCQIQSYKGKKADVCCGADVAVQQQDPPRLDQAAR